MEEIFELVFAITFALTLLAAWLTHVMVCLVAGAWGYLIAGAIFFPVAVVHGIMLWFGSGWV
jgi:hypothetical protein